MSVVTVSRELVELNRKGRPREVATTSTAVRGGTVDQVVPLAIEMEGTCRQNSDLGCCARAPRCDQGVPNGSRARRGVGVGVVKSAP